MSARRPSITKTELKRILSAGKEEGYPQVEVTASAAGLKIVCKITEDAKSPASETLELD